MYYVTGKYYTYMNNDGLRWFFFVCILFPNIGFLLYWLYQMRIEILKMVLEKKQEKFFRILSCGLTTVDKFRKRYMEAKKDDDFDEMPKKKSKKKAMRD